MNEARELDLQDRFINSKCAKYMLRAGQVEEAEKILAMFTRKEVSAVQDLTDMQCHWFHIEEGYAYLRQKNYGKALKRFHVTQKIFDDIYDDQFDFHGYCLRKMTIRAYVKYVSCITSSIFLWYTYFEPLLGCFALRITCASTTITSPLLRVLLKPTLLLPTSPRKAMAWMSLVSLQHTSEGINIEYSFRDL